MQSHQVFKNKTVDQKIAEHTIALLSDFTILPHNGTDDIESEYDPQCKPEWMTDKEWKRFNQRLKCTTEFIDMISGFSDKEFYAFKSKFSAKKIKTSLKKHRK